MTMKALIAPIDPAYQEAASNVPSGLLAVNRPLAAKVYEEIMASVTIRNEWHLVMRVGPSFAAYYTLLRDALKEQDSAWEGGKNILRDKGDYDTLLRLERAERFVKRILIPALNDAIAASQPDKPATAGFQQPLQGAA